MRDQTIPVFCDEKSLISSQYSNIIQGIRAAAGRFGGHARLIYERDFETVDFRSLPPVSIVTGAPMPFIQQVIFRNRANNRRVVLAGMDSDQFGPDVSCATPSRRTETQQLVNYLYKCGKERLALVGFGQNSINDNFRYHAAMSAVAAWGRLFTEHDVWLWQKDPGESFEAFFSLAGSYDAVICPNDYIAICFINRCKERHIGVPETFFVASFGNSAIGGLYRPSITSMTMDMVCVGEQAFNVWRFLMNNDPARQTALKIAVPSRILTRESTASLRLEAGEGPVTPPLPADPFYNHPTVAELVTIESCVSQRDAVDMRIIRHILNRDSYEAIADALFISGSTLRYRLNKIFADAGVRTRHAFEALVRGHFGGENLFEYYDMNGG